MQKLRSDAVEAPDWLRCCSRLVAEKLPPGAPFDSQMLGTCSRLLAQSLRYRSPLLAQSLRSRSPLLYVQFRSGALVLFKLELITKRKLQRNYKRKYSGEEPLAQEAQALKAQSTAKSQVLKAQSQALKAQSTAKQHKIKKNTVQKHTDRARADCEGERRRAGTPGLGGGGRYRGRKCAPPLNVSSQSLTASAISGHSPISIFGPR